MVLVGKPKGKEPLGRPRRKWEDNIEMYLQEVGLEGLDWIDLAQGRNRWRYLVNTLLNLLAPYNTKNFLD
jgi:hypothetical protein